jgi:hypothetical protein
MRKDSGWFEVDLRAVHAIIIIGDFKYDILHKHVD